MVNFKPSLWKSIVSIVVALLAFIAGYWNKTHIMIPYTENMSTSISLLIKILPRSDIYLSIICLVLVYVIWSLFQNKY